MAVTSFLRAIIRVQEELLWFQSTVKLQSELRDILFQAGITADEFAKLADKS